MEQRILVRKTKKLQNGNSTQHASPAQLILQLSFHFSIITFHVESPFPAREEIPGSER